MQPDMVEILACPACRGDVTLQGGQIVCRSCGRVYPVRDGIPVMLVDEAAGPQGEGFFGAEG